LQTAIGNRTSLSCTPSDDDWEKIYDISKQHTLTGIAFAGIERLPSEQLPPPRRIRQWAVKADKIKSSNQRISKATASVSNYFQDNGFNCIILKGQGNMSYYPMHLYGLRTPGDIDVWLWPNEIIRSEGKGDVQTVIEFCLSHKKGEYVYYHNLDFPILKDIAVEVHYRPSWLYNPLRNKKLQKWFTEYKHSGSTVSYEGYVIPTAEFNVIFQLLHLYKHIFEEGIGLRQLLDYYMVLKNAGRTNLSLISDLGLTTFAGAVMYVLQYVFDNTTNDWQICSPNEKEGRKLLREIMLSGNFGQFDDRFQWSNVTNGSLHYRGLPYAMARFRHNFNFLMSYPSEVICEPFFRIYNKFWIKFHLWKYE